MLADRPRDQAWERSHDVRPPRARAGQTQPVRSSAATNHHISPTYEEVTYANITKLRYNKPITCQIKFPLSTSVWGDTHSDRRSGGGEEGAFSHVMLWASSVTLLVLSVEVVLLGFVVPRCSPTSGAGSGISGAGSGISCPYRRRMCRRFRTRTRPPARRM